MLFRVKNSRAVQTIVLLINFERNINMSDMFNVTPQMNEYFNSLPKAVQESLIQSGASANSLEELKAIVEGFSGNE